MPQDLNKSQNLAQSIEELEKSFSELLGEDEENDDLQKSLDEILLKADEDDEDDEDDEEDDDDDEDEDETPMRNRRMKKSDTDDDLLGDIDATLSRMEKSIKKEYKKTIASEINALKKSIGNYVSKSNVILKSLAESVELISNQPLPIKSQIYGTLEKSFGYVDGETQEFKTQDLKKALDTKIGVSGADPNMVSKIAIKLNRGETLLKSELEFLGVEVKGGK